MPAANSENTEPLALITGASSGIGEAITVMMLAKGYRVIGTSRNESRLKALKEQGGDQFFPLQLDVTDRESIATLVQRLPAQWRDLDILVNNAGSDIGGRRNFSEGEPEHWRDTIETNVNGLIQVTYVILKGMESRGKGDIVNIGSIAGIEPFPTIAAYTASKYAVNGFSESLRIELEGTDIRVMQILPGMVRTEFAANRFGDQDKANRFYDDYGKWMTSEDVANTVLFVLEQPRHMTVSQMVIVPRHRS